MQTPPELEQKFHFFLSCLLKSYPNLQDSWWWYTTEVPPSYFNWRNKARESDHRHRNYCHTTAKTQLPLLKIHVFTFGGALCLKSNANINKLWGRQFPDPVRKRRFKTSLGLSSKQAAQRWESGPRSILTRNQLHFLRSRGQICWVYLVWRTHQGINVFEF